MKSAVADSALDIVCVMLVCRGPFPLARPVTHVVSSKLGSQTLYGHLFGSMARAGISVSSYASLIRRLSVKSGEQGTDPPDLIVRPSRFEVVPRLTMCSISKALPRRSQPFVRPFLLGLMHCGALYWERR